jgi:hypothetical protein
MSTNVLWVRPVDGIADLANPSRIRKTARLATPSGECAEDPADRRQEALTDHDASCSATRRGRPNAARTDETTGLPHKQPSRTLAETDALG